MNIFLDLLPNAHGHIATPLFLQEVVDILVDYIRKTNDRSSKVLDFHHPSTLKEMMAHCLDIQVCCYIHSIFSCCILYLEIKLKKFLLIIF